MSLRTYKYFPVNQDKFFREDKMTPNEALVLKDYAL